MTREEAIELLTEVDRKANENGEDGDGFVALKIAIEALKREDHDGCDGCEHEPKDEFTFPCVICKQNFVDMYEPTPNHDRDWIIGCIKHDGFIKTNRGDKANQIILEALKANRPVGYWKDGKWCSVCGMPITTDVWGTSVDESEVHYCIECGAKMHGERKEK